MMNSTCSLMQNQPSLLVAWFPLTCWWQALEGEWSVWLSKVWVVFQGTWRSGIGLFHFNCFAHSIFVYSTLICTHFSWCTMSLLDSSCKEIAKVQFFRLFITDTADPSWFHIKWSKNERNHDTRSTTSGKERCHKRRYYSKSKLHWRYMYIAILSDIKSTDLLRYLRETMKSIFKIWQFRRMLKINIRLKSKNVVRFMFVGIIFGIYHLGSFQRNEQGTWGKLRLEVLTLLGLNTY